MDLSNSILPESFSSSEKWTLLILEECNPFKQVNMFSSLESTPGRFLIFFFLCSLRTCVWYIKKKNTLSEKNKIKKPGLKPSGFKNLFCSWGSIGKFRFDSDPFCCHRWPYFFSSSLTSIAATLPLTQLRLVCYKTKTAKKPKATVFLNVTNHLVFCL